MCLPTVLIGLTHRSTATMMTQGVSLPERPEWLREKHVFEKVGQTGRGTEYVMAVPKSDKPDINPT